MLDFNVSHPILRHRKAVEVQLLDSKLLFLLVYCGSMLLQQGKISAELAIVVCIVRADHKNSFEKIH